jgi:hypothetical protein
MNYVLLLVILALGAGGYYEYTTIQELDTANKEKFADLNTKIDALQAENKKLEDDEKQLADTVAKGIPGGQVAAPAQTSATGVTPAPSSGPAVPPPSNDLGSIITAQKTYQECHLINVKTDCIVIKYMDGMTQAITQVKFADLRPELQKRFGYDPQLNNNLTPQQVKAAEDQRRAAGN